MKTRDLAAEMSEALAAMTVVDVRELEGYGVSRRTQYQMVGLVRIARITDTDLYEPDPTGVWAFVTPVRVEHPATPESQLPEACARLGQLVDIVAWDPRYPHDWALRTGHAYWLGCVPAQCFDPDPVRVWRSPLDWLCADSEGLVLLSRDPAVAYSLLMGFGGGIDVKSDIHAAELDRILRRPWPLPHISVGGPVAAG
jgi:hypothetical protein